jgi:hypothetical protein
MMKIQTVSKYIALSREGLVPELECPMDQGLLFCNLAEDESIYLYCLSCEYKNTLGTEVYNLLLNKIQE